MFKKLRIPENLLRSAGVRRVSDAVARKLGFWCENGKDFAGLVYPYFDLDGHRTNARLRRDNPELDEKGKIKNKYLSLPKTKRLLYLPPGAAQALSQTDTEVEVIVVESEKAALAVTAAAARAKKSLVAVATGGCWGWRGRTNLDDLDTGPLPDLALAGDRDVLICFDSNVEENEKVKAAERALATQLIGLDARVKCVRIPSTEGVNGPDDYLERKSDIAFWKLVNNPVLPWLDMFASYAKMKEAKLPGFIIKGFLQEESVTFIGGLPGHGKTLVLLSIVRSFLTGEKLFDYFDVVEKSSRVVYLTPEVSLGHLYKRLKLFHLDSFLESRQLLVRTLSEGDTPKLNDPDLLLAVRGADVFLDTAIRWIEGDESSASDNQKGLATGMFALGQAGARSVTVAHHAPKGFGDAHVMTLENVLRGSGDIAATASTVWAIRQMDKEKTLIYVDNVKARDFEPGPPFQIQARPYLDEKGKISMYAPPGESENLSDLLPKKGRPKDQEKQERVKLVGECVDRKMTDTEILERIKTEGMRPIKRETLKKDKQDARRAAKKPKY